MASTCASHLFVTTRFLALARKSNRLITVCEQSAAMKSMVFVDDTLQMRDIKKHIAFIGSWSREHFCFSHSDEKGNQNWFFFLFFLQFFSRWRESWRDARTREDDIRHLESRHRDNRGRGVSVFSVYRSNSRKIKSTRIVYWLSRDTPGRIRQITSRRVEAWRIALLVEFKYGADNDYETRGSNTKMATASNRRTHAHGWSTRCSAVRRGRDALARIT